MKLLLPGKLLYALIGIILLGGVFFMPVPAQACPENCAPIKRMLGNTLPAHYQYWRSGELYPGKPNQGEYLMLTNFQNNVLVLIVDSPTPLSNSNMCSLTRHMFKDHVKFCQPSRIHITDARLLRGTPHSIPLYRMTLTFEDGFAEPDIITLLRYPSGRTVVVLMGLPSAGAYTSKPHFGDAFVTLENEAQMLVNQTALAQNLQSTTASGSMVSRFFRRFGMGRHRWQCSSTASTH